MKLRHFSGFSNVSSIDEALFRGIDKGLFRGIVEIENPQDLHEFGINDGHIRTILHETPWGFAIEETGEYFEPLAWLDDPNSPDVGEWLPWHNVRVFIPA